ncbi:MAG TPA: potassium channel family protein [Planktothrix sp.]
MAKGFGRKLINWVLGAEGTVNTVLGIFSMIAVALVVTADLVNPHWKLPFLNYDWHQLLIGVRTIIWGAFVVSYGVYCLLSGRPLSYIKSHILELLVCACWIPHYTEGSFHIFSQMLVLSRFVPMDVLQLTGTLAHAWRVVRFTGQRFQAHPVFVTGAAAAVLVSTSAVLLGHFEPQTYHSFWEGIWFSLTTVTTIGFGPAPVTGAGKVITSVLIVIGMSLAGVFIGLISEIVRNKLFNRSARLDFTTLGEVQGELLRTKALVEKLQADNRETNALLRELVAQRESAPSTAASSDKVLDLAEAAAPAVVSPAKKQD